MYNKEKKTKNLLAPEDEPEVPFLADFRDWLVWFACF